MITEAPYWFSPWLTRASNSGHTGGAWERVLVKKLHSSSDSDGSLIWIHCSNQKTEYSYFGSKNGRGQTKTPITMMCTVKYSVTTKIAILFYYILFSTFRAPSFHRTTIIMSHLTMPRGDQGHYAMTGVHLPPLSFFPPRGWRFFFTQFSTIHITPYTPLYCLFHTYTFKKHRNAFSYTVRSYILFLLLTFLNHELLPILPHTLLLPAAGLIFRSLFEV